jgi:hypothetical protein
MQKHIRKKHFVLKKKDNVDLERDSWRCNHICDTKMQRMHYCIVFFTFSRNQWKSTLFSYREL